MSRRTVNSPRRSDMLKSQRPSASRHSTLRKTGDVGNSVDPPQYSIRTPVSRENFSGERRDVEEPAPRHTLPPPISPSGGQGSRQSAQLSPPSAQQSLQLEPTDDHNLQLGTPIDELIHAHPMFRECCYDFLETLILQTKRKLFRRGQKIVTEGCTEPQSMIFILWGEAVITSNGDVCEKIYEGETFGEAMLFGASSMWQVSVVASRCMVCELQKETIEDTLEEYPEEADRFRESVQVLEPLQKREERSAGSSWKLLRRSALLSTLSDSLLEELGSCMHRRLYFPGQRIIKEHSVHSALYMMEIGAVGIDIHDRVIRILEVPSKTIRLTHGEDLQADNPSRFGKHLSQDLLRDQIAGEYIPQGHSDGSSDEEELNGGGLAPLLSDIPSDAAGWAGARAAPGESAPDMPEAIIFGEEEVLGINRRSSCGAVARRLCCMRVVYRPSLLRVIAKHTRDEAALDEVLRQLGAPGLCGGAEGSRLSGSHITPTTKLLSEYPLFAEAGCSLDFLRFLTDRVENVVAPRGEPLRLDILRRYVHPPQPRNNCGLCIVNRGRLEVRVNHGARLWPGQTKEIGPGEMVPGLLFYKGHAKITPLELSFVSVLHQSTIARVLEDFADDRSVLLRRLSNLVMESSDERHDNSMQVAKILRERSIFSSTSQAFLAELFRLGRIRVFMPGDHIIEQGSEGTSMFILSSGCANVVKESDETLGESAKYFTNVGQLGHGSVFGELVMLGVQSRRTASIIANAVCCTWEVEHQATLAILDHHPEERDKFVKLVEEHLDKLAAPRIIYHPLFSRFHQQLRTLIAVNCERRLYFPGEVIIREGAVGDKLYIVNLGKAAIELHHQHVMNVKGGSHFGFAAIASAPAGEDMYATTSASSGNPSIGGASDTSRRYPVTITADTMCQVLIINRGSYQHALQKYPEMREAAMSLEAEERSRAGRQKFCFLRMIKRRGNLKRTVEALRGSFLSSPGSPVSPSGPFGFSNPAEDDEAASGTQHILEVSFQGWRNTVVRHQEILKAEEEQRLCNARRIETWLNKRRQQLAHVKPRIDMKLLLDRNLAQRGPLEIAKRPESSRQLQQQHQLNKQTKEKNLEGMSPYLSPSPIWRQKAIVALAPAAVRAAAAARKLPPLVNTQGSTRVLANAVATAAATGGAAALAAATRRAASRDEMAASIREGRSHRTRRQSPGKSTVRSRSAERSLDGDPSSNDENITDIHERSTSPSSEIGHRDSLQNVSELTGSAEAHL